MPITVRRRAFLGGALTGGASLALSLVPLLPATVGTDLQPGRSGLANHRDADLLLRYGGEMGGGKHDDTGRKV